ncbi:OmpA family protein [Parahaliea mediterranea]|nr:OmpA family protein [Parahaliea mediterranea]
MLLALGLASLFLYRYTTAGPQSLWHGVSEREGGPGGEPGSRAPAPVVAPELPDDQGAAEDGLAGLGVPADGRRTYPLLLPVVARVRPVFATLPRIDAGVPRGESAREPDAGEPRLSMAEPAAETAGSGVAPAGAIRVHFDFDSSALDEDSRRSLELAVHMMERAGPAARARISGYADPFGNGDYNLSLSRRRAETVANYMARLGVPPQRMEVRGLGSDGGEPRAAGVDAQRLVRVEIIPVASR